VFIILSALFVLYTFIVYVLFLSAASVTFTLPITRYVENTDPNGLRALPYVFDGLGVVGAVDGVAVLVFFVVCVLWLGRTRVVPDEKGKLLQGNDEGAN